MTNYMGKCRLQKIMLQMLSDRPELSAKDIKEFARYKKYHGSEWLNADLCDVSFKIYVTGSPCKLVAFEEYRYGIDGSMHQYNRVVTKYNENFEPLTNATWFSGGCALRKQGYKLSEDGSLNPDDFVCYDIAKAATNNKVFNNTVLPLYGERDNDEYDADNDEEMQM